MTARSHLLLDIFTGLLARFAPSLLALFCVPLYLHLLGASAYAAVGLAIALQMIVGLLDFGFSATITREAARISSGDRTSPDLRTLLRTFELLFWAAAAIITAVGLLFGHQALALIYGHNLDQIGLTRLDAWLLFASLALRFPYSCYSAYLVGITQVSKANAALAANDILRALVGVILLSYWEASLTMFFAWQALSSLLTSLTGWWLAHRAVEPERSAILVDWTFVRRTGTLAAGSGLMSLMFVLTNSIDKLVLPRFLNAAEFGQYVALTQLAAGAFMALHSIWSAFNPRIQIALAQEEGQAAKAIYETALATMTAFAAAAIIVAGIAGGVIAQNWSGMDPEVGAIVFPILMIGYLFAAVSHMPLSIQYAAGTMWPMLPAFSLVIVGVATLFLACINDVSLTIGAIFWSLMYVLLLVVGGSAAHWFIGRQLGSLWAKFGLLPLVLSSIVSLSVAFSFTSELSGALVFAAALAGGLFASMVVASSTQCRNGILKLAHSHLRVDHPTQS
jgi:O-antigen/teichoic acid export membrane protein